MRKKILYLVTPNNNSMSPKGLKLQSLEKLKLLDNDSTAFKALGKYKIAV
jgi:hypothetical protein